MNDVSRSGTNDKMTPPQAANDILYQLTG